MILSPSNFQARLSSYRPTTIPPKDDTRFAAVAAVVVGAAVKAAVILVDLVVAVVQDTPTQLTLQMQR